MKYVILIPIYNDRESLKLLVEKINSEIKDLNHEISLVVINDASSQQIIDTYPNLENISSFEIINMKENRGHARCVASGLKYIFEKKEFDFVIPMDGDGEDRPLELESLIKEALKNSNCSVVAKRVKRSEGIFFQFLYLMHKIITYFFTGKKINFGNYTCLTKKDAEIISSKPSLWSSYSGTIKKNLSNKNLKIKIISGKSKDNVQLNKNNKNNNFLKKYWKPKVSISAGINKIISHYLED